ncbi:MAG: PASTA domain-containing protein [Prevotella sp.]|nr:PASTA domain-containing protein [Prevotella sp.]
MSGNSFLRKFFSTYLWGNIFAIFIVLSLLAISIKYGLDVYTHHGESIVVPNIIHKQYDDAEQMMDERGLTMVVNDTGYDKKLPPDCILEQSPAGGTRVKSTHTIYVTINASAPPMLTIPDIIDNSSLREAQAQLLAMGFKVGDPQYIPGEKDWVYGILVDGKPVQAGDRVSADAVLIIQVGDGMRLPSDTSEVNEPEYEYIEVPDKPDNTDDEYAPDDYDDEALPDESDEGGGQQPSATGKEKSAQAAPEPKTQNTETPKN